MAQSAQIEVYAADGKKVAAGADSIELQSGLYVVKAVKDGKTYTVKAIVK